VEKLMEVPGSMLGMQQQTKDEKNGAKGSFGAGVGRMLGAGAASKRGSGGLDDDTSMEIDDDSENETGRATRSSKKRGGFGLGSFGKS